MDCKVFVLVKNEYIHKYVNSNFLSKSSIYEYYYIDEIMMIVTKKVNKHYNMSGLFCASLAAYILSAEFLSCPKSSQGCKNDRRGLVPSPVSCIHL